MQLENAVLELTKACASAKKKKQIRKLAETKVKHALMKGLNDELSKYLKALLALYKAADKFDEVRSDLEVFMPIDDEKAAQVVLHDVLKSHGISLEFPEEKQIEHLQKKIEDTIRNELIKAIFGSLATEEDEKVATEMFREALVTAQSLDDPNLLAALKRLILVKVNRDLQKGLPAEPDPHMEKMARRLFKYEIANILVKEAEAAYTKLVKKGRTDLAKQLLLAIFEIAKLPNKRLDVVHNVLTKAIKSGKKVNILQKAIELA